MTPATISSEQRDAVLVLTLNRPEVRNAVNDQLAGELGREIDRLEADSSLKVAVLTGAGRGFCSGMDLKAFARGEEGETPSRGFAGLARSGSTKPVIAAVEGFAVAGGFELALACDLIVASADCVFGLPEVRRNLVANGGALLRLPRSVPHQLAAEVALTGAPISAQRLHHVGLVNHICDAGSALDTALSLAELIAANPPDAVQATKRILDESPDWGLEAGWTHQEQIARPVWDSQSAQEGARAFVMKRAPKAMSA